MNYLTLGIDNMVRALFSSRLEITFLLDGLESRSAKLQIIELAHYFFSSYLPYSCTLSLWVGWPARDTFRVLAISI